MSSTYKAALGMICVMPKPDEKQTTALIELAEENDLGQSIMARLRKYRQLCIDETKAKADYDDAKAKTTEEFANLKKVAEEARGGQTDAFRDESGADDGAASGSPDADAKDSGKAKRTAKVVDLTPEQKKAEERKRIRKAAVEGPVGKLIASISPPSITYYIDGFDTPEALQKYLADLPLASNDAEKPTLRGLVETGIALVAANHARENSLLPLVIGAVSKYLEVCEQHSVAYNAGAAQSMANWLQETTRRILRGNDGARRVLLVILPELLDYLDGTKPIKGAPAGDLILAHRVVCYWDQNLATAELIIQLADLRKKAAKKAAKAASKAGTGDATATPPAAAPAPADPDAAPAAAPMPASPETEAGASGEPAAAPPDPVALDGEPFNPEVPGAGLSSRALADVSRLCDRPIEFLLEGHTNRGVLRTVSAFTFTYETPTGDELTLNWVDVTSFNERME